MSYPFLPRMEIRSCCLLWSFLRLRVLLKSPAKALRTLPASVYISLVLQKGRKKEGKERKMKRNEPPDQSCIAPSFFRCWITHGVNGLTKKGATCEVIEILTSDYLRQMSDDSHTYNNVVIWIVPIEPFKSNPNKPVQEPFTSEPHGVPERVTNR